ncbi:MAG: homoserine kinase [Gemmatimonadetes bacterium]|nr:homoserine kinase [Gemmatimonadota bacterium]
MIPDRPLRSATAFAPASIGNVAAGFDVLGHAMDAVGDLVTVTRSVERGVRIVSVDGIVGDLPGDPAANTATAGLLRMVDDLELSFGFEVAIRKGIPLGSGMGGSASSAVAGVVAASAVLDVPLSVDEQFTYAMVGEAVASGAMHGDNVAPILLGGLRLVRAIDPPDIVRVPVPAGIRCVLVHPMLRLDTRTARAVLPRQIPLSLHVRQSAELAGLVAGCFAGDVALIGRALADHVVEPARAPLVPGFHAVQAAARGAGALGCSLSGAGPSLFAWCDGDAMAAAVRAAMTAAFRAAGVESEAWISPVDCPGARIVETISG